MSTIKSSAEHLTLNADGASKDIKFQANGVEKASIDSSGNLTVSGNLTSVGIDDNADATAITIDSSENVMVTKTSLNDSVVGVELRANGIVVGSADGNVGAVFNRNSSDGDIIAVKKGGTTVGSIGSEGGDSLYIQSGTTSGSGLHFHPSNGLTPLRNGARIDNAIDLGTASSRFKDLYLSGGLKVGGTAAANTLDDYEEGTWTPASTSYASLTIHSAKYTKIGRQVTLQVYIVGNTPNANGVAITGLPFNNVNSGWSVGSLNYATANTNHTNPHVRVVEGSGDVRLMKNEDTNLIGTEISGHIIFTVTYFMS